MKHLSIQQLQVLNLQPWSFDLTAGECVCLSGPSGSGKSRLLRAIADLDPHAGTVVMDDMKCQGMFAHEWRRRVGLLPAESQWWYTTVGEHFTEWNEGWLKRLGFDADVGSWEVSRLSTGEKQRLALLRLLANHPEVLLLDELTANLDESMAQMMESIVVELMQQQSVAVIWVTHDKAQQQRVAQRLYIIRDQQVKEVSLS